MRRTQRRTEKGGQADGGGWATRTRFRSSCARSGGQRRKAGLGPSGLTVTCLGVCGEDPVEGGATSGYQPEPERLRG